MANKDAKTVKIISSLALIIGLVAGMAGVGWMLGVSFLGFIGFIVGRFMED